MQLLPDISCDFETRSVVDLKKSGVYPYAEHKHTDVWCLAFALPDRDEVHLWTPYDALLGSEVDDLLRKLAASHATTWRAWNASFERIIWREIMVKRYGFPAIELDRWYCTAAEAAALALPRALDNAARVLGVSEQKDMKGAGLMMRMAKPRNAKELKQNPHAEPIWWDDAERRGILYDYCKQDVRTERAVAQEVRRLTDSERQIYLIDQRVNDRGLMIDRNLVTSMQVVADEATRRANTDLRRLTGGKVQAVTKPKEIIAFLNELNFADEAIESVDKTAIQRLLATDLPAAAREVLNLRVEAGKSSVAKLVRMLQFAGSDDRMRGMFLYHGAGTGRWAGKGPQPQNFTARSMILPEGFKPEDWIDAVVAGEFDMIDLCFPVLEVLSMMLRACLVPAHGKRFIGGDFNAIEARVLAWLAGCTRILDEYRTGVDGYKVMGSEIYKVPLEAVTKMMRQMGKNARLGLGFGMGAEKFVADTYKKSNQIIELSFAQRVVRTYRETYSEIPDLWYELDDAAISAVREPGAKFYAADSKIVFTKRGDYLWMVLPSRKRMLAYYKPSLVAERTPWGEDKETVRFWGENGKRQWVRQKSYGGLWAENATQAVARDLMAEAMLRVDAAGYPIVLHAHDELLGEVDEDFGSPKEFEELMCVVPPWAKGLPVKAEVEVMSRYKK